MYVLIFTHFRPLLCECAKISIPKVVDNNLVHLCETRNFAKNVYIKLIPLSNLQFKLAEARLAFYYPQDNAPILIYFDQFYNEINNVSLIIITSVMK